MDHTRQLLLRERLSVMMDLVIASGLAMVLSLIFGNWPIWAGILGVWFVWIELDTNWRMNRGKSSVPNGLEIPAWFGLVAFAVGWCWWAYSSWSQNHPTWAQMTIVCTAWVMVGLALQIALARVEHRHWKSYLS